MSNSTVSIKSEPTFYADASETDDSTYFSQSEARFSRSSRNRPSSRRSYRGRGRGYRPSSNTNTAKKNSNRRVNPADADGEVSRCIICDSRMHWARECPHSYENNSGHKPKDDEPSKESFVVTENVQLSLFSGFTKDEATVRKVQTLMT